MADTDTANNMFSAYGSIFDAATADNVGVRDRALDVAKLQPGRATVYGAHQAGGMLMQNLAGMAGMKTAEQQKAETITNIMKESAGLDHNDPSSARLLAQKFMQANLPGIAQKFLERARDMDVKNQELALTGREVTAREEQVDILGDDLSFREEKEKTAQKNLQASLKLTADEVAQAKAQGTIVKIGVPGNTYGAMMYARQTFDEDNNPVFTPIRIEGFESSEEEGDKAIPATGPHSTTTPTSGSGDMNTVEGLNNSGYIISDFGTTVSSTDWSTADESRYSNLWDLFKKDYYKAGSIYDTGSWQLSEADIEAGMTEVPSFYDWAKARGGRAAELVDRGTGGDKRLAKLKAEDEVKIIKELNSNIDTKTLAEENDVPEAKLKEVPETITMGEEEFENTGGLNYGVLLEQAKEAENAELVEALIIAMKPKVVAPIVVPEVKGQGFATLTDTRVKEKKEVQRFGKKGE